MSKTILELKMNETTLFREAKSLKDIISRDAYKLILDDLEDIREQMRFKKERHNLNMRWDTLKLENENLEKKKRTIEERTDHIKHIISNTTFDALKNELTQIDMKLSVNSDEMRNIEKCY